MNAKEYGNTIRKALNFTHSPFAFARMLRDRANPSNSGTNRTYDTNNYREIVAPLLFAGMVITVAANRWVGFLVIGLGLAIQSLIIYLNIKNLISRYRHGQHPILAAALQQLRTFLAGILDEG
jgi:hypothetical protein